jgi:hypothetical protein
MIASIARTGTNFERTHGIADLIGGGGRTQPQDLHQCWLTVLVRRLPTLSRTTQVNLI